MNKTVFMIPALLLAFGAIGFANAQLPEEPTIAVLDYDGSSASVEIKWAHSETIVKYEAGCVSCTPNTTEFTVEDNIILSEITPFQNTSRAMLYLIAYDAQEEIIDARQILVELAE